jgi:hypothetical protein
MNGRRISVISGLAFLILAPAVRGQSSTPREETWVTNRPVYAIARTTDTVYIGGEFTYVGPYTGPGVPISASSGQPVGTFPKVNGPVYACVPDGSGGWFIGGYFTQVGGGACNYVAHIRADGSVDAAWNPNANGRVFALAVSGSTIYAEGEFTSIGGQTRNHIAALDASTGQASAWNPSAAGFVAALAVSGSTVYAGGEFTTIGGQPRACFAQFEPPPTAVDGSHWILY